MDFIHFQEKRDYIHLIPRALFHSSLSFLPFPPNNPTYHLFFTSLTLPQRNSSVRSHGLHVDLPCQLSALSAQLVSFYASTKH